MVCQRGEEKEEEEAIQVIRPKASLQISLLHLFSFFYLLFPLVFLFYSSANTGSSGAHGKNGRGGRKVRNYTGIVSGTAFDEVFTGRGLQKHIQFSKGQHQQVVLRTCGKGPRVSGRPIKITMLQTCLFAWAWFLQFCRPSMRGQRNTSSLSGFGASNGKESMGLLVLL